MKNLKILRKSLGLTQQQLADKLFVNRNTYQNYEAGTTEPDFATVKKIASFFNVTIDYLVGANESDLILISKDDFQKLKIAAEVIDRISKSTSINFGDINQSNVVIGNNNTIKKPKK
ncbi:MAG: helix-turn-helix domain-containing protein [Erysipelotrichales bacterium]|nr:helix-turn-helix domain-containing protein [Erysipelotrichales bacterium]